MMEAVKNLDTDKILGIVDKLDFFRTFSRLERRRFLGNRAEVFVCEAGDTIIEEGLTGSEFFILLDGVVGVFVADNPNPVAKLKPGDCFGEVGFLTGTARTASIVAEVTSFVLRVDDHMFQSLSGKLRETFKDRIIEKLAGRLEHMNQIFSHLSSAVEHMIRQASDGTEA